MTRLAAIVGTLSFVLLSCSKGSRTELKTDDQKFSYLVGQQIGNSLKQQGIKVDGDVLAQSIEDVTNGAPSRLSPEQMQQVAMKKQQQMMQKQMGEDKDNKAKGDKVLEENKKRPGVKVTKSGLQYE